MTFDLYFNISRTAIEIVALGVIMAATVYVVTDLIEEEEKKANASTIEG